MRPSPHASAAPSNIVIGFVGGFVSHDNPHHGPVQLAQQIRQTVPKDTYVRVFENRRRKQAYDAVLRLLDTNRDGVLSAEEKARARIVLFGHSWGASAAVLLARDLRRQGIPVLLTVQVDSVAKVWQNDSVIPDNVAEAVNFYQTQASFTADGRSLPPIPRRLKSSETTSWITRRTRSHAPKPPGATASSPPATCRANAIPTLWSQIETMVRQRLRFIHFFGHARNRFRRAVHSQTLARTFRKQNIIDKPRRSHECRHRDQRAARNLFNGIQAVRIYDLEIVEPHRFFSRNFFAARSHQFFRIRSPPSHDFFTRISDRCNTSACFLCAGSR